MRRIGQPQMRYETPTPRLPGGVASASATTQRRSTPGEWAVPNRRWPPRYRARRNVVSRRRDMSALRITLATELRDPDGRVECDEESLGRAHRVEELPPLDHAGRQRAADVIVPAGCDAVPSGSPVADGARGNRADPRSTRNGRRKERAGMPADRGWRRPRSGGGCRTRGCARPRTNRSPAHR